MTPTPTSKGGRTRIYDPSLVQQAIELHLTGRPWRSIGAELGVENWESLKRTANEVQRAGGKAGETRPDVSRVPSDATTPSNLPMCGGPSTSLGVSLPPVRVDGFAEIPSPGMEVDRGHESDDSPYPPQVVRDHESDDSPYPPLGGPQRLGDRDPSEVLVEHLRRVSDELVRRGRVHHATMTVQRDGGDPPTEGDAP